MPEAPDEKRSGPPATEGPPQVVPAGTEAMVSHRPDRQRARARLAEQQRRIAISTELETLAPLVWYYQRHRLPGEAVA